MTLYVLVSLFCIFCISWQLFVAVIGFIIYLHVVSTSSLVFKVISKFGLWFWSEWIKMNSHLHTAIITFCFTVVILYNEQFYNFTKNVYQEILKVFKRKIS
jgi:hypothetical protein